MMTNNNRTDLFCVLAWISLLMTASPLSMAAEDTGSVVAPGDLRQALESRGWGVERSEDGTMTLVPPAAVQARRTGRGAGGNGEAAFLQQVRALGWDVKKDREGAYLFYPPGKSSAVVAREDASRPETPRQERLTRIDELVPALESHGWRVQREEDGSVTLMAPQGRHEQVVPSRAGADLTDRAAFVARLRSHGWRVLEGRDGSLTFFPPPAQEEAAAKKGPPRQGSSTAVRGMDKQLLRRHWRMKQEDDGTLLLYPKSRDDRAGGSRQGLGAGFQTAGICPGVLTGPVRDSLVDLPVDQWGEARRIAQAWLEEEGEPGMVVGKIRRILKLYLVSIVASVPPFTLRHQIAIRVNDGRAIGIY